MNKETTIKILEDFNAWRLGADIEAPDPKRITYAILSAIEFLKDEKQITKKD